MQRTPRTAAAAAEPSFKPYAYSFDRETFRGDFATREQAVEAGLRAADRAATPVAAIFVGRREPADPQADGHAEDVVRSMRRRLAAASPDRGGGGSVDADLLRTANEHVMADLDAALERAIVDWLARHGLAPATRFAAISEHAAPTVHGHGPDVRREVGMIGQEE